MKNKYNPPNLSIMTFPQNEDVLNASGGGTFGTIGDYDGDFLE